MCRIMVFFLNRNQRFQLQCDCKLNNKFRFLFMFILSFIHKLAFNSRVQGF